MPRSTGLLLIAVGVAIVLFGLLVWSGALGWFGRLPGDVRVEGERSRVYFPIVSMLVLSVAITLIVSLIRRFL